MEPRENPIFGRKVFFLNPSFTLKNRVINALIEDEYETYVYEDYRRIKGVLRMYPDSICFINIEEQLSHAQWFNFVKTFEADPTLSSIFLGIISSHISKNDKMQFIMKTKLPAGFIDLTDKSIDPLTTIRGILRINGAKGRRQYIRANCLSANNAYAIIRNNNIMYKLKIQDISVVGISCLIRKEHEDKFKINSVIRDISITVGTNTFAYPVAVFAVKVENRITKIVLLFLQGLPINAKNLIRKYISTTMYNQMLQLTATVEMDTANYSQSPTSSDTHTEYDEYIMEAEDIDAAETPELADQLAAPEDEAEPAQLQDLSPDDLQVTQLF